MAEATPALLVSAVPRGYGAARMPRALARAGFTVTLLAPRSSLAGKSGFVSRVGHLPDGATARQWLYAFGAAVRASAPRGVRPRRTASASRRLAAVRRDAAITSSSDGSSPPATRAAHNSITSRVLPEPGAPKTAA